MSSTPPPLPPPPPRITVLDVTPIGSSTGPAFVNRGEDSRKHTFEALTFPTYPPSLNGRSLRVIRSQCGVSMGDAARALGISVTDQSGLERGSKTLSDTDWLEVFRSMAGLWIARNPPRPLVLDRGSSADA